MKLPSIIVPHYNTPDQLEICIKLIRYYTPQPYELIVVDNGSKESDFGFLNAYPDIILIRRVQDKIGMEAHGEALDVGIEKAKGFYIVTLHSDSFVIHKDWLAFLIGGLEKGDYDIFGPYTHKLYPLSRMKRLKRLLGKKEELSMIRPLFSIYRAAIFREKKFSAAYDVGELSVPFVESGKAAILQQEEACRYVYHLGGTTKLENLRHRKKASEKKERQYKKFLQMREVQQALNAQERILRLE